MTSQHPFQPCSISITNANLVGPEQTPQILRHLIFAASDLGLDWLVVLGLTAL